MSRLKHFVGQFLRASLEEEVQQAHEAETQVELEYVYFGKIVDFDELKKADRWERQEQWEVRTPKSDDLEYFGTVRVRKIEEQGSDEAKYVLTIKTGSHDDRGKDEINIDASKDVFELIKRIATGGSIKTRYIFPYKDSKRFWEIDVYQNADAENHMHEWCKIDLEVGRMPPGFKPEFPIQIADAVINQHDERTPEEAKLVEDLMNEKFILKNAHPREK